MTRPDEPALIETVAAGIAHEVRNPLNALQINVRILEQELAEVVPDRTARVYLVLSKIANELTNLDNFVSEFLRFARPPRVKLEQVHVRHLVGDLATFITPECAKKNVALHVALERGPIVVMADNFQLKHALLNLVLNALQSTPPGGQITIATAAGAAGALLLEVTDDGEGIPPEVLPRVFEVFYTTREGGTGLGLPIAKRIIEEHGGTLVLVAAPRQGTIARITLPARAG